jgi:starch phosphorylase
LGILSGDHAKSASDLGFPFVALSLFYRHGYFQQRLTPDGWQQEELPTNDPQLLPMTLVQNEEGGRLLNSVEIGQSSIYFQTWKVRVGRIPLYLMDTNIPENEDHMQTLTDQVYGGDIQTRIGQEILLGIGGVRLLRSLNIEPAVFHMNEGHSAFLTFELLREQLAAGKQKDEAEQAVRRSCVFTTHTPVPAGHDRFTTDLMHQTFEKYWSGIPLPYDHLLGYGRIHAEDMHEPFTMTVLALKMSRAANGVSELHGNVSREMWKDLYPAVVAGKVPIGHITNGVHTPSWASMRAHQFWNRRLGYDWTRKLMDRNYWSKMESNGIASDEELWGLRFALRRELVEFVHRRLQHQSCSQHAQLSADALTICFARRFATYKRAPLLFRNLDLIIPLFKDTDRPLQIVFAGKAHPRDGEGKRFIQRIIEISRLPELSGKVAFIENYDMNVARYLVAGADVWLNTPRRPLEASGTRGMKVLIHGGLNLSIMDGWWREAYNGINGWSIGDDTNDANMELQDERDFQALTNVLTNFVIPEFYSRDEQGIPRTWIKRIRSSMRSLISSYSTERMVADYVKKYYLFAS